MSSTSAPIPFAGSELNGARHVCAFFNSEEEEYRVLLPFIRAGFECGDRALHVINPEQRGEHLERLNAAGIASQPALERGQLEIRSNLDAYLASGRFDQDRMLELFEQLAEGHPEDEFPRSRIVCRMDWAAPERSDVHKVVEFESRVNQIWRHHDHAVICTYQLHLFGGDTVVDIMRTHPMVIIGGILQHNPFFVPPEVFLRELRERRGELLE